MPLGQYIEEQQEREIIPGTDPCSAEDIGQLMSSISAGLDEADALGKQLVVLESLKNKVTASPAEVRRTLTAVRIHRLACCERLQVSYSTAVLSFESLEGGSLVLALEEEEKDTKGFFASIIDAIIKAFEKLWEMITGVFKSAPDEKTMDGSAEKAGSKVKEAINDGLVIPPNSFLDSKKWNRAISHLGDTVTIEMLEKAIDDHKALVSSFEGAIDIILKRANELKSASSNIRSDSSAEELEKLLAGFDNNIIMDLRNVFKTPYDAKVFGGYKPIPETATADQVIVAGPIITAGGPCAWVLFNAGQGKLKTAFSRDEPKEPKGKIAMVDLGGLSGYETKVTEYVHQVGKLNETVKGKLGEFKSSIDSIKAMLKGLESSATDVATPAGKAALQGYISRVKNIGGLEASLMSAVSAFTGSAGIFVEVLNEHAAFMAKKKAEPTPAEGDKTAAPAA